jgi:hypothetical protein
MRNTVEFRNGEVDLVVAALLSMACPLCPLNHDRGCGGDPQCRKLAERVAGGELAEVYGHGDG